MIGTYIAKWYNLWQWRNAGLQNILLAASLLPVPGTAIIRPVWLLPLAMLLWLYAIFMSPTNPFMKEMSILNRPNILFLMCDQFRFDCIHALGNQSIRTPNLDRLVARGVTCTNAYSACPVCVPARLTVRTGCESAHTGCYENEAPVPMDGQDEMISGRCGKYLAQTLKENGYRTFGVGKFHAHPDPYEDLGYENQQLTEEIMMKDDRSRDAFASFIDREHPEFSYLEQLHGERTEMYYMPQTSPLPASLTVESFVADRVIEQLRVQDQRPYFAFASFIGPHPPCAPPIPYNRMYNPDRMENPIRGNRGTDLMDEQLVYMNHAIWADEINDFQARVLKCRYYGEISYIDEQIGRILDEVERRGDADNTLICFFADHGDHLGDHHSWQKESYFEQSCHVPFLLSWPEKYAAGSTFGGLISLTDLFGIATTAAGCQELRDGEDILGMLSGRIPEREAFVAVYGRPGTRRFKCMVRWGDYKYIYLANGGMEQLFQLKNDPHELKNLVEEGHEPACSYLRQLAVEHLDRTGWQAALETEGGEKRLKKFSLSYRPATRIRQFGIEENNFTDSL